MADIVDHYIRHHRERASAELAYYANVPSLAEAVARAARAEDRRGRRHAHQRRLPRVAQPRVLDGLSRAELADVTSFEDLHRRVDDAIGPIRGVAALMVYDTALRLGAFLGVEPVVVYLHAGTRDGAEVLGVSRQTATVEPGELPPEFGLLKPREIEDCLCIYKAQLTGALQAFVWVADSRAG